MSMHPKRIILEGKSYLMLEENLGKLNYTPFKEGSINAKYYSNYEPITAVGISAVDTITKKTIDKKKVEIQDLKFAIKFKWNVDVLISNPDLFLRYYNYFESAPQTKDGKKSTVATNTVNDFMAFINDKLYSKTFSKLISQGDLDEDQLFEAKGNKKKKAEVDPEAEELKSHVDSFEDGFTDPDEPEYDDIYIENEPISDDQVLSKKNKNNNKEYFFYLVFKYDDDYDYNNKLKVAAFNDSSNIEIIKLVSEGHIDNPNVAITGKVLERRALGFYRELLGILNANHKSIIKAANNEIADTEMVTNSDYSSHMPNEGELNFDDSDAIAREDGMGLTSFDDSDSILRDSDIPQADHRVQHMAERSLRNSGLSRLEEKTRELDSMEQPDDSLNGDISELSNNVDEISSDLDQLDDQLDSQYDVDDEDLEESYKSLKRFKQTAGV